MSLNTQLRIFLLVIFFLVLTGNFLIGVNDTKQFLQSEAYSRTQDTSTSLALSLNPLMSDISDPKIASMMSITANRGFFKEIRLESIAVQYSAKQLLEFATNSDFTEGEWQLTHVSVSEKHGQLTTNVDEAEQKARLSLLNETTEENTTDNRKQTPPVNIIHWMSFLPNDDFVDGRRVAINFQAMPIHSSNNNISQPEAVKGTALVPINRVLFVDARDIKLEQTPQWFVDFFPIKTFPSTITLSDGWKKVANLSMSPNPADAYHRLYNHAHQAFIYSLITLVSSMLILSMFLHKILRPLVDIQTTVEKIGKGAFDKVNIIPKTTEFKKVTLAINDMSDKLSRYSDSLNNEVMRMSEKINIDSLTQLPIRQAFEVDFKQSLSEGQNGYVFIIKINNLENIVKSHEHSKVDEIIRDFANILTDCSQSNIDEPTYQLTPYRFFGGEFCLLAVNTTEQEATELAQKLTKQLSVFAQQLGLKDFAHIGAGVYESCSDMTKVLHAAHEALESAKQIGPNAAMINPRSEQALDLQQWRRLAEQCVENNGFDVDYVKPSRRLSEADEQIAMVEAFTKVQDSQGNKLAMATFISVIEKFHLHVSFDQQVINKITKDIEQQGIQHQVLINLSINSISNADFIHWLVNKVTAEKKIAPQLVFSITAYAVANQQQVFKQFIDTVQQLGSSVIIKRYDPTILPIKTLNSLKVDAVRLAREQTLNISDESSKQQFVKALQELTVLLDMKLYAEGVVNDTDIATLKKLGVYAASK